MIEEQMAGIMTELDPGREKLAAQTPAETLAAEAMDDDMSGADDEIVGLDTLEETPETDDL